MSELTKKEERGKSHFMGAGEHDGGGAAPLRWTADNGRARYGAGSCELVRNRGVRAAATAL
jgi:hypothetical protein